MELSNEQRLMRRLHFNWPVWYAEDFHGILQHGQMVDVSTDGMAFTCSTGHEIPHNGRMITIRFSVPRFGVDDSFNISNFVRSGHVCRTERVNDYLMRIAIKFTEQLPFDPFEHSEADRSEQVLAQV